MRGVRGKAIGAAVAAFSLALGIALGAGPLGQDRTMLPGLSNEPGSADPAVLAFESGYIGATGGQVLGGRLSDRSVALVTVAGASASQVKAVRTALRMAGAKIASRPTLTTKLTDPANRQFVDGVARQSAMKVKSVAEGKESYGRIGAALTRALIGKPGDEPDSVAATIWAAFAEGGLVTGDAPKALGDTVVLVVGGQRRSGVSTVIAELTRGIDAGTKGSVLAGPADSSLAGGAVAALRETTRPPSSVDVTDSSAGGVVVALALQRDIAKKPGAWGTPRSANGALPD